MKIIKNYENACQKIAEKFRDKYLEEAEIYWAGLDVGGVCQVGDYYFDMDQMITALKYKATQQQVFDYYNADVELRSSGKEKLPFNFENYVRYPNNFFIEWKKGVLKYGVK